MPGGWRKRSLTPEEGAGLTWREWAALCARGEYRCTYCERVAPLTVDHVEPLSRGGIHDVSNVVPCCQSCNTSKGDSFLLEWVMSGGPPALRERGARIHRDMRVRGKPVSESIQWNVRKQDKAQY